jgi:hypothetical protein
MTCKNLRIDDLRFSRQNNTLLVHVPWDAADALQECLRRAGIGSTLHLDPAERAAFLRPWADLAPDRLRVLLEQASDPACGTTPA